jgi:uncharacterized membrane protein YciS (DUF1049 family)
MSEGQKKDIREFWLPVGSVFAVGIAVFWIGSAWAGQSARIENQEIRISKLEAAVQGIGDVLGKIREGNVEVKVSLDNLTRAQDKMSAKVDKVTELVK